MTPERTSSRTHGRESDESESPVAVDIWVDFVCPFSYIATSRIETAAERAAVPVELTYHSFQLMPDLPEEYEASNAEFFRDFRGVPPEELAHKSQPLIQMTADAGLPYSLPDIQQANTLKAHQLLHYAKTQGRQIDAAAAIFRAHFAEGKSIGRLDVLLTIAKDLGLDPAEAERALASGRHRADVRADISRAGRLGIRVVPFLLFQNSTVLTGGGKRWRRSSTFSAGLGMRVPRQEPDSLLA